MVHNSNLMYSIYPVKVEEQDVLDTFFVNSYGKTIRYIKEIKTSLLWWTK